MIVMQYITAPYSALVGFLMSVLRLAMRQQKQHAIWFGRQINFILIFPLLLLISNLSFQPALWVPGWCLCCWPWQGKRSQVSWLWKIHCENQMFYVKSKYSIGNLNLQVCSCETEQWQSELPNLRLALLGKTTVTLNLLTEHRNVFGIHKRTFQAWHHSHPPLLERLDALKKFEWFLFKVLFITRGTCEVPLQGTC